MRRLKGKKEKRGSKEKVVTLKSLRGMNDVVDEVDRLMDKKFSLKADKVVSDSDQTDYSCVSSSSACSASSAEDSDCGRGKDKKKKKSKRSKSHRSGKIETRSSYVKNPQRWANTQLALHFACTREKKLEELSIPEFCAGFLTIMETSSKSKLKDDCP